MDVVDGEWVRWVWGLTSDFAGVFGGVLGKKFWHPSVWLMEEEQAKQRQVANTGVLRSAQDDRKR